MRWRYFSCSLTFTIRMNSYIFFFFFFFFKGWKKLSIFLNSKLVGTLKLKTFFCLSLTNRNGRWPRVRTRRRSNPHQAPGFSSILWTSCTWTKGAPKGSYFSSFLFFFLFPFFFFFFFFLCFFFLSFFLLSFFRFLFFSLFLTENKINNLLKKDLGINADLEHLFEKSKMAIFKPQDSKYPFIKYIKTKTKQKTK